MDDNENNMQKENGKSKLQKKTEDFQNSNKIYVLVKRSKKNCKKQSSYTNREK